MVRRVQWAAVWIGTALSLLVSLAIANIWLIIGSEQGNWIYQYVLFFDWRAIWIALLTGAAAAALLAVPQPTTPRHEWLMVFAWLLAALGLQALLRSLTHIGFERNLRSAGGFSFYTATQLYPPGFALSHFEQLRPEMPLHTQSNMPGKLMFMYAAELITNRPAVLPWVIVAVSNLGGLLMYAFVRDVFGDRRVALYSLVLYLFMPAKLYLFPQLNTITPVVVLVCIVLLLRWIRTARVGYAALFGAAVYGLAFFEPAALSMGLLMAVLMAHAWWRGDICLPRLLVHGGIAALAFAIVYFVMRVALDFDLLATIRLLGAAAAGFNVRHDRPYGIWVRQNLLDFLFGIGICQATLFAAAPWRRRVSDPIVVLCASLTAILLILDIIGISRGEVVRLWIFLACFFQIPAAYVCARLGNRAAIIAVVVTTLLQDALGTLMIGFIMA